MKEVEIGDLQIVEDRAVGAREHKITGDFPVKNTVSYLTHQCNLCTQPAIVDQQQMLSVQTTHLQRPEISALLLKGDEKKVCFYTGLPNNNVFEALDQLLEPLPSLLLLQLDQLCSSPKLGVAVYLTKK